MEAPEKKSLPATLAPALRSMLLRLGGGEPGAKGKAALQALASFVGAMKFKYADVEFSWNIPKALGVAEIWNPI